MANRFKGEATVKLDGKTYTLRCDFNAMAAFEEETGKASMEVFEEFESGKISVKDMLAMMLAFMLHHHPDSTSSDAGDLLSEDIDALKRVVQAASPTAKEVGGAGKRKARAKAR